MALSAVRRRVSRRVARIRIGWTPIVALAVAFICPPLASAQDTLPLLEVGTRVRLESRAQQVSPVTGSVVFSTPDSLGIQRRADLRYMARAELGRVQVSGGRDHGSGALKGAGWGALVVAAPIVLFIVKERASGPQGPEGMDFSGAILISGTAAGAVIGAMIGGMIGSERWLTRWESRADQ